MVSSTRIYRFGDFRLDLASRQLRRAAEEVPLHRKAFDCIVYLIEHRDRAVEREELLRAVWGHSDLSDKTLNQAVLEARRALNDTGGSQVFIKTIRTFGYYWVASVEVETAEEPAGAGAARRLVRRWLLPAMVVVAIAAVVGYWIHDPWPANYHPDPMPADEGMIALLLPVQLQADRDHDWIRLGLMDLIAERLRAAGQPMVPSDNVIALLRVVPETGARQSEYLTTTTGASLILEARVEQRGPRWWISLRNRADTLPPLTAFGEADDVLDAARIAADQMAVALGLVPVSGGESVPDLHRLLQQIEAARLALRMDVARELIDQAGSDLEQHPEVRFQRARMDYYGGDLGAARAGFESLLDMPAADASVLRARALNGLAAIEALQGRPASAESLFEQATRFAGDNRPDVLGTIYGNWAGAASSANDLDLIGMRLAQARRFFEGTGNVLGLANLDLNAGTLEAQRGRYAETLRHYRNAVARAAATQDIGLELRTQASMIYACLVLLDLSCGLASDGRITTLLPQAGSAELVTFANLNRAALLEALGEFAAAEDLLRQVLSAADSDGAMDRYRLAALALLAEWRMRDGDAAAAREYASAVIASGPDGTALADRSLARARLASVRVQLALADPDSAAAAVDGLTTWARQSNDRLPEIHALVARAELAAARGRAGAAGAAYGQALRLAAAGHAPRHLLLVAQSYIPWLLDGSPYGGSDPERALLVMSYLSVYADRHFEVALLQLRIHQALGPAFARRMALAQARSLAGERKIPSELLNPPD